MSRLVPITALILAGALSVAHADVYRWVDAQGVPHYSDEWVPGSVVVKTTGRERPDSSYAPSPSPSSQSSRIHEQLTEEDNNRAVQQDVTKAKAIQCEAAKARYNKSIVARRIYKEDANGDHTYLSDEDAEAYRQQARQAVQDACGSVPEWKPDQPIPEPQPINPQPIPEPKVVPQESTSPPTS
ncbi:MAG: DUF4124 domain-containing protein [Steroidobacteraceae bacterium]